ncbi:MAG: hypothetical protein H7A25_11100 [Leptospiraceae bacterium]|nr:hypothetical protein [Leptospiraceae bacterium]
MNQILVIGANSVSGQDIIQSLQKHPDKYYILGSTSGDKPVPGVHKTLTGINLSEPSAISSILKQIGNVDISHILYIPARGMVGLPTTYSTKEMVEESFAYSVIPMLQLTKELKPLKTICFSGFITMPPMLLCYGCMALTKIIMEELAIQFPDKLQVIRLGMFFSKSVRGIALATQRSIREGKYPELKPMLKEWKESGQKFNHYFFDKNWFYEENIYKNFANNSSISFRKTVPEDITKAVYTCLEGEKAPIINVLGDWVWTDTKMIPVPDEIESIRSFAPKDLNLYF